MCRNTARTLISAILAVTGVLILTTPAGALPRSPSPDSPDEPGLPTFELPGDGDPPLAPGLRIRRPALGPDDDHEVLSRSFDVTIIDRSDHERGTRLERRADGRQWTQVTGRSVLDQDYVHRDRDLDPDTRYCYRAVAHNFAGSAASAVQCAVTRAEAPQPVARVQLQVLTADVSGAGTVEKRTAASLGQRNSTWLDLPGGDFGRGSSRNFDLVPAGIADLTDIEHLRLSGGADDPWCVDELALRVNGSLVFQDDFDAEPDGCRWFGNGRSTVLNIPHRTLRDHPRWGYARPQAAVSFTEDGDIDQVQVTLPARELESRLEGLVGHALRDRDARWHSDGVTVTRSSVREDHLHVTAALTKTWTTPFGGTIDVADVDIDLDLFLSLTQTAPGDDLRLHIEPRNIRVSLPDWLTWAGRIFDLLPCGPVASVVTGDGIPGCFDAIKRSVERLVQNGVGRARVDAGIPGDERCCRSIDVEVLASGGVQITVGFLTAPASSQALGAQEPAPVATSSIAGSAAGDGGASAPTTTVTPSPSLSRSGFRSSRQADRHVGSLDRRMAVTR